MLDDIIHEIELNEKSKNYLFKKVNGVDIDKLKLTNVGLYSFTPWYEANMISENIKKFYKNNNITISDTAANAGGNSINFLINGFKLNCVEIDKITCDILKHNLEVYGFNDQIVHCNDYTNIYKELIQDCIYIDAPWGGKSYKNEKCIDLFLSNLNILSIVEDLFNENKITMAVLKVPTNYNFPSLHEKFPIYKIYEQKIFRKNNKLMYSIIYIHL